MNPAPATRETPLEESAANVEPESMREESMSEEPTRGNGHAGREPDYETSESDEDLEQGFEQELEQEQDLERMMVRLLGRARERIREQPLTATAGAFIVGFAIGNGVPKFLARAGIAIGLRMVMQRMFDRAELFESDE